MFYTVIVVLGTIVVILFIILFIIGWLGELGRDYTESGQLPQDRIAREQCLTRLFERIESKYRRHGSSITIVDMSGEVFMKVVLRQRSDDHRSYEFTISNLQQDIAECCTAVMHLVLGPARELVVTSEKSPHVVVDCSRKDGVAAAQLLLLEIISIILLESRS